MTEQVKKLWPELDWISESLREKTAKTWEIALERSVSQQRILKKYLLPFYADQISR